MTLRGTGGVETGKQAWGRRGPGLVFEETESERTQEFVLRWSGEGGSSFTDIVRQQWNFSPPASIREAEEYQVQLSGITVLELIIRTSIGGGNARASLKNLRLS
jgi:hypothetical protein